MVLHVPTPLALILVTLAAVGHTLAMIRMKTTTGGVAHPAPAFATAGLIATVVVEITLMRGVELEVIYFGIVVL